MRAKVKLPSIDAVAVELRTVNMADMTDPDPDAGIDVRLQVCEDGTWNLLSGLSDYDQDHRGFWGSSMVPGNGTRFNARDIAKELIDQVREAIAEQATEDESFLAPFKPAFDVLNNASDFGGSLALMECTNRNTGRKLAVVCHVRGTGGTDFDVRPLAVMLDAKDFDNIVPPPGGPFQGGK